jgi:hypothetical protein
MATATGGLVKNTDLLSQTLDSTDDSIDTATGIAAAPPSRSLANIH